MLNGKPSKISDNRSSRGLKLSVRQSRLEASEACSGSSVPQKIIDVVIPVRISHKIRVPTDVPSLEEALSIPLLESNGEAGVPGIQQRNLAPVPETSNLRILLGNGIS